MSSKKPLLNPFIENLSYITRAYELCSEEPCTKYSLTQTELDIIAFLANNPGTDTAGDITTYRYISKASVSITVESLIRKKLIIRKEDTDDRRRIHLILTAKAETLVPEINRSREKLRKILFKGFEGAQKDMLLKAASMAAENAHTFIISKTAEVKK